jgi:C-type lysozyme/alpha-lactalbumin family
MSTTITRRIIILLLIFAAHYSVVGKSFAPCELASELIQVHNFTLEESRNLVCIAQKLSNLNTNVIGGDKYGIFQISQSYCDRSGDDDETSCDVKCDDLLNEDIRDDIQCVRKVLSSRGLSAWRFDKRQGCRKIFRNFDNRCMRQLPTRQNQTANQCEYAKRLNAEYQISKLDALVWACIDGDDEAQTKTGNVNEKFQAQKFNDLTCVKKHDVECAIKKRKQAGFSGNDFQNWSAFERSCKNVNEDDVKKCFEEVQVVTPRSKYTTSTEISIVIEDGTRGTFKSSNEGVKVLESSQARNRVLESSTEGRKVIKNSTVLKNDAKIESSIGSTVEGYSKVRLMKNDEVDKNITSESSLKNNKNSTSSEAQINSTSTENYLSTKNPELIKDDSTELKEIPLSSVTEQKTMTQENVSSITENIVTTTTKTLVIKSEVSPTNAVTSSTTTLDTSLRTISSTTPSTTADSFDEFDFDDDWFKDQIEDDVTGKYEVSKEYENIDKCHLAKNIKESGRLPKNLIPTLLCIAENESHLNVSSKKTSNNTTRYGLFQINDKNYCNTNDKINECDVLCEHLNDDQFDNDWECVSKILEKEGFKYWPSYSKNCSNVSESSLDYCYIQSTTTHRPFAVLTSSLIDKTTTTIETTTSTEKYEIVDKFKENFTFSDEDILRKLDLCELSQQLH